MIYVIAQNPKTDLNKIKPMRGTPSYGVLRKWLLEVGIDIRDVKIVNACSKMGRVTKKDIDLSFVSLISMDFPMKPNAIITLGTIAKEFADVRVPNGMSVFNLPHPSGLNRKLNDPNFIKDKLKDLKKALERNREKL
jgi:uracil-DNA glycosylase